MKSAKFVAVLYALLFAGAGIIFLPLPGIQNDEAIFAGPLYPPHAAAYVIGETPVMLMDYAGCLKTWLFAPIFAFFSVSPWSLRIPVILLGAMSVLLFTLLVNRACGSNAALIGGALLVADPVFALTNNFDWGPVALQHFLLTAGMLAAMEFSCTRRVVWVALAFFSFGLGLWDKALFIWLLLPVIAAAVLLWPVLVRQHATLRNITVAITSFALGAAPLLWFNATHGWVTFRSHTAFSLAELPFKLRGLRATLEGSVLFGYMVRGEGKSDLMTYGLLFAALCVPFLWQTKARRPALFSIIVMGAAWAQMAFNRDTGGSAHHIVLLWPFPHLLIAAVFSQFRRAGLAIALFLVITETTVYYRYWTNLKTFGPAISWTDAIYPLSQDPSLLAASSLCLLDWGLTDPLLVLHRGTLPIRDPNDNQLQFRETLWVSHVTGQEFTPGLNARLEAQAAARGLHKVPVNLFRDGHGNPIFETFRFE